jgi:tetratricopeptide (TPR) repeat protein
VERVRAKPDETLDARDLAFRAYVDWARAGQRPEEDKAAYEVASRLVSRALAIAPENLPALYVQAAINLSKCIASWSDDVGTQEAIGTQAMEKFLRLRPHSTTLLLMKGELYHRHGRFEEALQAAESAMELDPKNRAGLLLKTAALMHLGRLDKALETSNKQLQLEDDDARVAALAAAVRYRTKNYADAAGNFSKGDRPDGEAGARRSRCRLRRADLDWRGRPARQTGASGGGVARIPGQRAAGCDGGIDQSGALSGGGPVGIRAPVRRAAPRGLPE